MVRGPGSDGRGAVGGPQADVGVCCPAAVLSCGSGGKGNSRPDTKSLRQRLGDGEEWMDDLEEGGRTSYDDMEAEELAAQQQRPFVFTCPSNCKRMTPVAFICLLLVSYCNTAGII